MKDELSPTIGLNEAAALLRCHPDTVRKMAKLGEIPGTKVGRAWVFRTEGLLDWLKARCESKMPEHGSAASPLAERLRAKRLQRHR